MNIIHDGLYVLAECHGATVPYDRDHDHHSVHDAPACKNVRTSVCAHLFVPLCAYCMCLCIPHHDFALLPVCCVCVQKNSSSCAIVQVWWMGGVF